VLHSLCKPTSSCRTTVNLHERRRAFAVVRGETAHASLRFLDRVWLFTKLLDSKILLVCLQLFSYCHSVPPLVHLALLMRGEVGLALKKLCAFFAVMLPQTRQIFYGLLILEFCEMLLVAQVGVDLIEIARVPARLLLGVLSSDGRHVGLCMLVCRIRGRSAMGLKMWRTFG
jgi:hypothetical protein